MITRKRLQCGPMSYIKRMNLLFESNISNLTSYVVYSPSSTSMITWGSAGKHLRLYPTTADMCTLCYRRDLRVNVREGSLICAGCGCINNQNHCSGESSYTQSFAIMSSNNRQPQQVPRRHSPSNYKRCNHFKEVLLRIQAKHIIKIGREHMDLVRAEVSKRGLDNESLDAVIIRKVLKSLKLQRYYNDCYYVMKELTGEPLVTLTKQHCQILFKMFVNIQIPFAKHAPQRANMISYFYVIKKLCEIRGWDDIAWSLPHLKSRTKVVQQDAIWRKICLSVDYPFIRSII